MAVSKAHIKASNKYNKDNYKKIQANIRPDDYNMIDEYCRNKGLSKATLIVKSIRYIISHGVDLSEE